MKTRAGTTPTALWRALYLALALLCAGCGPGVGGTGTGQTTDPLGSYGATAADVCLSSLASILQCPAAGSASAAPPGTSAVVFADGTTSSRVRVRVEGNRVEVDAPCAGVRFSGVWGAVPGQAGRFFGSVGEDPASAQLASLSVQAQGQALVLQLQDAQGRVLLGPLLLQAVAAAPPAAACQ
jgi:hypothetical protein